METVVGSVVSAFVDAVAERLTSIDWLKYVGQGQVRDQLKRLGKMLRRIEAAVNDAEETQSTSRLVQDWLTDLKCLAYDLEDLVDQLATEDQQRVLEDQEDKDIHVGPSKLCKMMSCFAAVKPATIMFNKEMLSKIDDICTRLDVIIKEKDDLKLGESNGKKPITRGTQRPPMTSVVNEAKVYGREDDKKAVLELLKAANDDDVAVVPIVGMGGLGKTTLAQLIYNDSSLELEFDFKAWVSVGEDFDVFRITRTILQSGAPCEDLNSLQVELKNKLSGKRFLIILDDVWSEKYDDWTIFRGPLEAGAPKSKIIITTRSHDVSRIAGGSLTAYHLKELSYDECLSVFCQHALGATNFTRHLHLKAMGEEIVRRCKGLPLAAKALGGLLKGKLDCNAWEEVLNSKIWELSEAQSNILPALKLSYRYLPPHLKRCFAYCSIFPKDYEFDKNEMILLWKAEGFLVQKKHKDHKSFDELLSRSFFQQSNDNKSRYVMHDLIHDLAQSVSGNICFHLGENNEIVDGVAYENIRHSAFMVREYNLYGRFECFHKMVKLRTFLSLDLSSWPKYLNRKVLHDLVPKLKCLRVLSLTKFVIEELPSNVGELKQLRYLDLSNTTIRRLPESIGNLINLETLKLCHCDFLVELPKSICNLINLSYLDIAGTGELRQMPAQIGNLTSLHRLSKFIVGEGDDVLKISELKKLSQLAGKLHFRSLQNVGVVGNGNFLYLKEKPGLLELCLYWDYRTDGDGVKDEQILKSLEPHQNVSSVLVKRFGGEEVPSWVGDPIYSKMVHLELVDCVKIKSLPPLGRLPSLKELRIEGLEAVEEVGSEFYEDDSSFPCLESLQIVCMSEWKQWSWPADLKERSLGKFRKLCELSIENCPKLKGEMPSLLPSLEQLTIVGCGQLTELPGDLPSLKILHIRGCEGAVLTSVTNVPSLTELKIEIMKGLSVFDESFLQAMVALQKWKIGRCPELRYLWADDSIAGCLTSLKHLEISDCRNLVSLVNGEDVHLPFNLQHLRLSNCDRLRKLPNGLDSLKNFDIVFCHSLEDHCNSKMITHLETRIANSQFTESACYGFSRLKELHICKHDGDSFPERELPAIPNLTELSFESCGFRSLSKHMESFPNLQSLRIEGCRLESFPDNGLPNLSLVSFEIRQCPSLKSLPTNMQNLTSLQSLTTVETGISSLESCFPPNLTQIQIEDCQNLNERIAEWGLLTLTSLKTLSLSSNTDVESFLDKDGLLLPTSLIELAISQFNNIESISRGLQNLTNLRGLIIFDCGKLKSFPVTSLPPTLEFLRINRCPHLKEWCSNDKGEYGPFIQYYSD